SVPDSVSLKLPPRPFHPGQNLFQENPTFQFSELDDDVLTQLYDEFRDAVFAKKNQQLNKLTNSR
ncbi:MAG: hypothetical protein H0U50_06095, partial [Pyrinomonadaceae bacterium]|nr:hypothetical protein [Pyrinomonadaceae bacterium]